MTTEEIKSDQLTPEQHKRVASVVAELKYRRGKWGQMPPVSSAMIQAFCAIAIDADRGGSGVSVPQLVEKEGGSVSTFRYAMGNLVSALKVYAPLSGVQLKQLRHETKGTCRDRYFYTLEFVTPCSCCGGSGVSVPQLVEKEGGSVSTFRYAMGNLVSALKVYAPLSGVQLKQLRHETKGTCRDRYFYTLEFVTPCSCCGGSGAETEKKDSMLLAERSDNHGKDGSLPAVSSTNDDIPITPVEGRHYWVIDFGPEPTIAIYEGKGSEGFDTWYVIGDEVAAASMKRVIAEVIPLTEKKDFETIHE